uniref:phosphatidylinositol 4-kinase gamma 5-like n=1 Tax=Erigeron canadensis TaxID=72917 RepID=UPI001CB8B8F4|nr:phosphatidylinositol 4-kinase gamma 5-like [Erigeron canadensis]
MSRQSRNLESPVQTQMAVAAFSSPLGKEYHRTDGMVGVKSSGRRRVFVQTETGCVLGMELDRSDNAHTVKRRLQIALNVPVDESSLTFGDMVLKNDLSAVRNDSPLLLTRNSIHRSSSSPCLSPTGRDMQQGDRSGPIEILGNASSFNKTKQIVKEIVKAIKIGVDPIPVQSGLGGAYYFRNSRGEIVAIVKPTDEEPFAPNNPKGFVGRALGQPGLKRSVRVGETGYREVAAYLLDHGHFANVPPTALVKITHSIFNVNDGVSGNGSHNKKPHNAKKYFSKLASFQQFIPHDFDASDHGTSSFPVAAVHRIGILDIRIFNTDRHAGNLLVRKVSDDDVGRFSQAELIPIDHGLCLPENLEDPYFEWIHWPQASIPFTDEELKYIKDLNPYRDAEMLKAELPMIREASLRVLVLCTIFLKEAAGYGLTLAEIGEMMSREFRRGEEEPSELEVLCLDAMKLVGEREWEMSVLSSKTEGEEDSIQFEIDCDGPVFDINDEFVSPTPASHFGSGRNPFSKHYETIEEEDEDDEEHTGNVGIHAPGKLPLLTSQSMLLKNNLFTAHNLKSLKTKTENKGYYVFGAVNSSSGHRSASEQLPASVNFVKLADMNDEEWGLFLEKFQELVYPAFANRKSAAAGQRQRQRLGTSCQF